MCILFGVLAMSTGSYVLYEGIRCANEAQQTPLGYSFVTMGICMIIAGIFTCLSKNAKRKGFVWTSILIFLIAIITGIIFYNVNSRFWLAICILLGLFNVYGLIQLHKENIIHKETNHHD